MVNIPIIILRFDENFFDFEWKNSAKIEEFE